MSKLLTGQVTISASAQPCSTAAVECRTWILKALKSNAGTVFFGDSTVTQSTGHALSAGEEFVFEFANKPGEAIYDIQPQDVYVVGTASDKVTWVSAGR